MTAKRIFPYMKGILMLTLILGQFSVYQPSVLHAAKEKTETQDQAMVSVNVNKASAEELLTVRGIGPTLADRIIAYRKEAGAFKAVEDLINVPGIGEAKLQKIKSQVSV